MTFTRTLCALSCIAGLFADPHVAIEANIKSMNDASAGFDVIVICTSTPTQAQYWEERLIATKGGSIAPQDAIVVGVDEDWNGKAGNGMGTLYAFQKAAEKVQRLHQIDLSQKLVNNEFSVAIYHTAGKGTRLAPIHLAENSNKPGLFLCK